MVKAAIYAGKQGWIRNGEFDLFLILGVSLLAFASATSVLLFPALFITVLTLDLWLLGYHHVISTYTRLCFDRQSFKENFFLVTWLPIIVAATTVFLSIMIGNWLLATVYFYWQWFHYTRQSYGVQRIYERKSQLEDVNYLKLSHVVLYLIPLWGILHRSWQNPHQFLNMPARFLPVPGFLVNLVAVFSLFALSGWLVLTFQKFFQGRISLPLLLYSISHHLIFLVSYILISDLDQGWLLVNIWHNAQYILIVWLFNTNRFQQGIVKESWFLSFLSQPQNFLIYLGACLSISTVFYYLISRGINNLNTVFPLTVAVYATINFHHYIVDGLIWKVRKKPIRERLGVSKA